MNQKTKYIGMLAIIPLVMIAIVPNYIGEADAFEPEVKIIQISNSTLELVSDEDYITPIIVIISIEQ